MKGRPERNKPKMLKGMKKDQLRFMIISNVSVETITIIIKGIIDFSQNAK